MKLFIFLLIATLSIFSTTSYAQRITLHKKNASPKKVLEAINKQTGFTAWYKSDLLEKAKKVDADFNNASVAEAMDVFTTGQPFSYEIINTIIVLKQIVPDSTLKAPTTIEAKPGEIVSDGYQQINKGQSPGSYDKLDRAAIERNGTGNILSRLNGVNGLTIQTDSKGNSSILIRGRNSINSGTDPLIVLDGFPYEGDVNNINVNNIEDVTILKDATATSMWGVRGGNGVIVITTRKASSGQTNKALADAQEAIVLKKGMFKFNKAPIDSVMSRVAKLYNMEIVYKSATSAANNYSGALPENIVSDDMLKVLAAAGLKFKVEGKRITVL